MRQSEEEIRLVLRAIGGALQQPATSLLIEFHARIVAGCDRIGADLLRDRQQLIELKVVVAEAARDGSASRQILLHERTNDVALKAVLVIDYVIGNANRLGDAAGIVHVVQRAAAALDRVRHALVPRQPALVPELHRQADNVSALRAQHGRHGRGVNPSRHGYGDGLVIRHLVLSN